MVLLSHYIGLLTNFTLLKEYNKTHPSINVFGFTICTRQSSKFELILFLNQILGFISIFYIIINFVKYITYY